MSDVIVVGGAERDYWAKVDGGVITDVIVAARNPRKFGGIDEDIIPRLRESFPESEFVILDTNPRPGVGWLYNAKTKSFEAPAAADEPMANEATVALDAKVTDPKSPEFLELVKMVKDALEPQILAKIQAELASE